MENGLAYIDEIRISRYTSDMVYNSKRNPIILLDCL